MNDQLATLCLNHLRSEETLLKSSLSIAKAIQDAFGVPAAAGLDAFAAALGRHRELTGMFSEIQRQRRQFVESAIKLGVPGKTVTIASAQAHLTGPIQGTVAEAANRVLGLARELTAANFVLSVHVRVHLNAYRRILRDLTNTKDSSGRYSRAGHTETLEYRPLLQING